MPCGVAPSPPPKKTNKNKILNKIFKRMGLPYSSDGKESACNAGNPRFIPGSGRSPGEVSVNPLQYSGLENLDRVVWWATVQGVAKSRTQLSD